MTQARDPFAVRTYWPSGQDEGQARAVAVAALRDKVRAAGYVLVDDTVAQQGREPVVRLGAPDPDWAPCPPGMEPDAHIVTWTAMGEEPVRDNDVADPVLPPAEGLGLWFLVPPRVQATGGGVRVRHGFPGPVEVFAYREYVVPVGYPIAVSLTAGEEHVEVLPGTVHLRVAPDDHDDE